MNGLDSTNSDLLINIWRHNEMDVSFEDYAESWISMNKVPLHNQTVDFMRILALLCHDSVEHRIMMDDGILNVLDNLVNEPRTAVDWSRVRGINNKSRFLGTYQQSVHRLNVLKNKYGVPMLKPPVKYQHHKVVVKNLKKL